MQKWQEQQGNETPENTPNGSHGDRIKVVRRRPAKDCGRQSLLMTV